MADKPEPKQKLPLPKPRVGGLSRFFLDLDARIGHAHETVVIVRMWHGRERR